MTFAFFWQQSKRVQWLGWGIGEFIGDFLGITTPRYQSEMLAAERERKMREEQAAITKKCYVNEAGELEEQQQGQGDHADTVKLDHVGQEIKTTLSGMKLSVLFYSYSLFVGIAFYSWVL